MRDIFNINRFIMLFKKHTIEHYKSYAMSLLVLMGVLLLGIGYISYMQDGPIEVPIQIAGFGITLLLSGTIFTSTIFADMGEKSGAIASLTLPASQLEKFLVAWIYTYIIFQLVFTGAFYLIMMLFLNVRHAGSPHNLLFNLFDPNLKVAFVVFTVLHSIAFYGAIFFKKLNFIKTGFVFFLTLVIIVIANKVFVELLVGRDIIRAIPFAQLVYMDNKTLSFVGHPFVPGTAYALIGLAVILWVAAYYRLKEKQV
jgi:hypothetical protein